MGVDRYSGSSFGRRDVNDPERLGRAANGGQDMANEMPYSDDRFGPSPEDVAEAIDSVDDAVRDQFPVAHPAGLGEADAAMSNITNERDPLTLFSERMRQLAEDAAHIEDESRRAREDVPALQDALKVFVKSGDAALLRQNMAHLSDAAARQEIVAVNVLLSDLRWADNVYDVSTGNDAGVEDMSGGE